MNIPMTDEEYVQAGGLRCPFCRSENVSSSDIDLDGPHGSTDDECEDCGKTWTTFYGVVGYKAD